MDNVQYVSLICSEAYGVEIVDLTEALLAVNTNSQENPVDITDLTEDEIKALIRNTLEVTLNGEVYEEFELLFEETLTLPEEGVLGVPVVVVYPGDEVTLRAEVQTIVYVEVMPDPVLTVTGNTIEYPVEVKSLDELEEAVRSVLEVYLDDVLINEYQILFGEEFMLNEETVEEILVTVSVTVDDEEIQGSASVYVVMAAQDDEPDGETPTDDTETEPDGETPTDETETDTEGETPTDDTDTDTEGETPTDDTETDTEGETPTDDTETDTEGETPTDDTETDTEGETPTDDTETDIEGETPTDDTETGTDGETPTDDTETGTDGETPTDETETGTDGETPTDETETGTDGEVSVDETDTENTEENTDTETADVTEEPME